MEVCPICHEVVGEHEVFRCICGDLNPGSRTTVKCQTCKFWSHIDCARKLNSSNFTCGNCNPGSAPEFLPDGRTFADMAHNGLSLERSPNLAPSASQLYFKHWILMQQASGRAKVNVVHAAKEAANEYAALSKEEKKLYARLSQAAKDSPSVRLFGTNTRGDSVEVGSLDLVHLR
ncbi:hypothetical protein DFH06DRAFT_1472987 [Mycena polygramma]|nr:hypothetical protein DFH06DRAFT_1472987 [Mycena polygramma]